MEKMPLYPPTIRRVFHFKRRLIIACLVIFFTRAHRELCHRGRHQLMSNKIQIVFSSLSRQFSLLLLWKRETKKFSLDMNWKPLTTSQSKRHKTSLTAFNKCQIKMWRSLHYLKRKIFCAFKCNLRLFPAIPIAKRNSRWAKLLCAAAAVANVVIYFRLQ